MELSEDAKREIEESLAELQEASDNAAKFVARSLGPGEEVPGFDPEEMNKAFDRYREAEQRHRDVMKKHFGF